MHARIWNRVGWMVLVVLVAFAVAGCASSKKPPAVSGDAQSLALLERLREAAVAPDPLSGTFSYTMTQDRTSHFAEDVLMGQPPVEVYGKLPKETPRGKQQSLAVQKYVEETLAKGIPQGNWVQQVRYEQAQQGELFRSTLTETHDGKETYPVTMTAWDGDRGLLYQPRLKYAQEYGRKHLMICYGRPCEAQFFSMHCNFTQLSGALTTRHEKVDGRDLVVLRLDIDNGCYREFYLDPAENLLPRRIVFHWKIPPKASERPSTMPQGNLTVTRETKTRWFGVREESSYSVPADVAKLLDWNYGQFDMDTTVDAYVKRPDGRWFVTRSTTHYPFSRRTEVFEAHDVSFNPLPKEAFELKLPTSVKVRD